MQNILDQLKRKQTRDSTAKNYFGIWRNFNQFVVRLDVKPRKWEDRVYLYCAYSVKKGNKSVTLRSYISAIKAILRADGYELSMDAVILHALTQGCRLRNDTVSTHLPIQLGLLDLLLFELNRKFGHNQPYLMIMYQTMFAMAYYGLFRIGELAASDHSVKAKDVHISTNKDKILMVLYSLKTHGRESQPQKIRIQACDQGLSSTNKRKFFCPFTLMCTYFQLRGRYDDEKEIFFVFRDGSPVTMVEARKTLRDLLLQLGLNCTMYGFHSFRVGRATDMMKWNYKFEQIKLVGRWRSNVIYKYIRQ